MATSSFPYISRSIKKYRSPHSQDLSFPKGALIRVLSLAPKTDLQSTHEDDEEEEDEGEEDEDIWLIGELADGSARGTFPGNCVVATPEEERKQEQEVGKEEKGVRVQETDTGVASPAVAVADASLQAATELDDEMKGDVLSSLAAYDSVEEPSKAPTAAKGSSMADVSSPPIPPMPKSAGETPQLGHAKAEEMGSKSIPLSTETPAEEMGSKTTPLSTVTPVEESSLAAPSATSASPVKSGPPAPKPKPSGLAARIAAFNQPAASPVAAAPPPLPRGGKPLGGTSSGWKRPQPREGEKPVLPGPPPASSTKPTTMTTSLVTESDPSVNSQTKRQDEEADKVHDSAFSAADAASSIKLSLKERMAALQRGGGDSEDGRTGIASPGSPSKAKSPPISAAKPGKLSADRRAAALAGMGVGGGAKSSESTRGAEEEASAPASAEAEGEAPTGASTESTIRQAEDLESVVTEDEDAEKAAPLTTAAQEEKAQDDDIKKATPEEEDSQRRAAIAQRLARLGGQRVGGQGPPMFGAPRPPPAVKKISTSDSSSSVAAESSPVDQSPSLAGESVPAPSQVEEGQPKTLDVPRRAAPPRKKRSAASPLPTDVDTLSSSQVSMNLSSAPVTDSVNASTNDTGFARTGSPLGLRSPELEATDSKGSSTGEGSTLDHSLVTPPSAPRAASPSHSVQPEGKSSSGLELTSEPPALQQVAEPGQMDEDLTSDERAMLAEGSDAEADRNGRSRQPSKVPVADVGIGHDDDGAAAAAALRHQAARLEAFLAGPGGGAQKNGYEDTLDVDGDADSSAIPSPLARQLGLVPGSSSEGEELAGGNAFENEIPAVEADQGRGGTSANVEMNTGELHPVPSCPSSTRPPIPLGQRPASRASIGGPPARDVPTPPIPASASQSTLGERRSSLGRPPIPRSPPPRTASVSIEETLSDHQHSLREEVGADNDTDGLGGVGHERAAIGPALAVPLARRAIPLEEAEAEEDEGLQVDQGDLAADEGGEHHNATAETGNLERIADAEGEQRQTQEIDGEEASEVSAEQAEASRRAAIAKRMAALGGHRLGALPPIMGAPMPARERTLDTTSSAAIEDDQSQAAKTTTTATPSVPRKWAPPRGGMAIPGMTRTIELNNDTENGTQDDDDDGVVRHVEGGRENESASITGFRSPPVKPTSPPPLPGGPTKRASLVHDSKPMTLPPPPPSAGGNGSPDQQLKKGGSQIRPPIPGTGLSPPPRPISRTGATETQYDQQPSIETSLADAGGQLAYEEDDEVEEDEEGEEQGDREEVNRGQDGELRPGDSPPVLPVSPPPRAPPRAPPSAPPSVAVTESELQVEQSQGESRENLPALDDPRIRAQAAGSRTSTSGPTVTKTSARDLNLAIDTRWWRETTTGGSLRMPPSISNRHDAIYYIDTTQAQGGHRQTVVKVMFEDYAVTTILVQWVDGDEEENETRIDQTHSFAPNRPAVESLRSWSGSAGVDLAQRALLLLQSSSTSSSAGGSSKEQPSPYPHSLALVSHLINTGRSSCLPPVGLSFGPTILSQVGQTILDRASSEEPPRAGDVLLLQGPADFKGKKGLGSSYHAAYGSNQHPLVGIVVEVEKGKKGGWKIRIVTQQTSSMEEVTVKLEDLKSGVVKIMRVARRGEWVRDW